MNKAILIIFLLVGTLCSENATHTNNYTDIPSEPEVICDVGETTCKGRVERKPYQYEDLFKRKGHEHDEYLKSFKPDSNYTDYYDFALAEDELLSLKYARISIYPQKKFLKNSQGNFLHFYKIAHDKKLPVYFTTDSMLYAFNENLNMMSTIVFEDVLIHVMRTFLEKMIDHAEIIKETMEGNYHRLILSYAQVYYGTALDMLVDGFEKYNAYPDIATSINNNKELANLHGTNDFFIMMKKRTLDTSQLFPPAWFRRSKRLSNFYRAFKWLTIVKFDLKNDLNNIWLLGKLIEDSGSAEVYDNIYNMISYIIGQDRETSSYHEIYKLGKSMGFESIQLSTQDQHELYKKIIYEMNPKQKPDLGFSTDVIVYSKEALNYMQAIRQHTSFLFAEPYNIEEWTINKLLDYRSDKNRFLFHSIELPTAIHQCKIYKDYIFSRYRPNGNPYERDLPLRDGIDVSENFEKAKYTIKNSMKKEPHNWRKNIVNNMHLLLYKATRRIKKSSDPLFKSPHYYEKNFNTAYGGYIHFKQETEIMNRIISSGKTEGAIPEVVFEPNLEFYQELNKFFSIYQQKIIQFVLFAEQYLKINYETIKTVLTQIFEDIDRTTNMILRAIPLQEMDTLPSDLKKEVNNLIFFNDGTNQWDGWYYKLLTKSEKNNKYPFSYPVYISRVYTATPLEKFHFNGAIIYTAMKFPDIGILIKKDKNGNEKLLLYSSYGAFEFLKQLTEKIKFDDITSKIVDRNY